MPEGTQTPAAGGYLTQQRVGCPDWWTRSPKVATLLLQPLQAASLFLASGVKIFDTAGGNNLRIPKLVGSTGASWVAEAANIPDDDVTFGELSLLPKSRHARPRLPRNFLCMKGGMMGDQRVHHRSGDERPDSGAS
jgi:hypothetical protein